MSYYNGPKVVTDGLRSFLDAGNQKSYIGSGTSFIDISNNGNNGTLTNSPTFSNIGGGSILFDGTNYVALGNLGSFYTQGTLSFWMYSTAVENYRNPVSTKREGGNACMRFEQYTNVSPYGGFNLVIGNDSGTYGNYDYSPTGVLTPNAWYEVVAVWNTSANTIVGHLNGVKKINSSHSLWPSTLPDVVLGNGFDSGRYFKGNISNFKLYNRALTDAEVVQNYNATKTRFGL